MRMTTYGTITTLVKTGWEVDMMFCNEWVKKFPQSWDFSTKQKKVLPQKHRNEMK